MTEQTGVSLLSYLDNPAGHWEAEGARSEGHWIEDKGGVEIRREGQKDQIRHVVSHAKGRGRKAVPEVKGHKPTRRWAPHQEQPPTKEDNAEPETNFNRLKYHRRDQAIPGRRAAIAISRAQVKAQGDESDWGHSQLAAKLGEKCWEYD